jgi:hypothetical protein
MYMLDKKEFIMWNGVDLELYIKAHEPICLVTVLNFLELFQWDKRAEKALRYIIKKHGHDTRVKAEQIRARSSPVIETPDPSPLPIVCGRCSRCLGLVRTGPVPGCEAAKTNRVTLKECDNCSYYSEIFLMDGKYIEIEGD